MYILRQKNLFYIIKHNILYCQQLYNTILNKFLVIYVEMWITYPHCPHLYTIFIKINKYL